MSVKSSTKQEVQPPVYLFFDELDSVGTARGSGAGGSGAGDRVLN